MTNPSLFVVGAARSGTELLRRILDAHPEIAITPESHWIARYAKAGLVVDGKVTPELVERLERSYWFGLLEIGPAELRALVETRASWAYAELVSALFDLYGSRAGKPVVGDKTPSYVRSIGLLHRLFADARFVHIIRDGRDVTLSILDWPKGSRVVGRFSTWADDPVTTSALWWEWSLRRAREAASKLPPRLYYEIRYESVIGEPEQAVTALCEFLGVAYDAAMLAFHRGREIDDPQLDAKDAWRPITAGLRDWRQQMTRDQLERFEASAGDLLDELGYPRGCSRVSSAAAARAAELRRRFIQDAHELGSPVPKHWQRSC